MNHICDYKALLTVEALDKFIKDETFVRDSNFDPMTQIKIFDHFDNDTTEKKIIEIVEDNESKPDIPKRTRAKKSPAEKESESKKKALFKTKTYEVFNQPDILIAVQNDNKFLNFIMSIRHISPNVFMYVEGINYLVFMVNSAESYPVIIAKFQIEYPTIVTRNIADVWFSFPISTIANFITKTDKQSYQYSFILRNYESKMVLEYTSTLDNVMKSSENLNKIDKQITLDTVFFNKIHMIKEFEEDIGVKNIDYISMIYNMPILLMTECKDFGLIEKIKNLERAEEIVEVNEDNVIMNITINSQVNKIVIVNRYDKISGLVHWADTLEPMRLKMPNFTSLFKTTDRLKNKNEFCYYLLCKWKSYSKAETYMFIKIVTKMRIEKIEPGITFGQLFNTGNLLYELFLCYRPIVEKQIEDTNCINIGENIKDNDVDMDFI